MKARLLAAVLTMGVGLVGHAPALADDAIGQFKRDWKGQRVVLKQPLYTVQYQAGGGPLNPGRIDARTASITLVHPVKGTYYYAKPNNIAIADSDPERLVERVTAVTANVKLQSFTGQNKRNVTTAPAVLLRYPPGTVMTVADVFMRGQWIRFDLNDDFYKGGPNTTALLIEWSSMISSDFADRGEVESLISTFLVPEAKAAAADAAARDEAVPPEFRDAAARKEVVTGMSKATVFAILGEPSGKRVDLDRDPPVEKWQYNVGAIDVMVVTFEGGKVTKVDRF